MVVAHFPHSSRPFEDFVTALDSFHDEVQRVISGGQRDLVLMGDLNASVTDGDTDRRSSLLLSTLSKLDLTCFSHDTTGTRWAGGSRLDHVVYSDGFKMKMRPIGDPETFVYAEENFRWEVKEALGCDHVLLTHEILWGAEAGSMGSVTKGQSCRRQRYGRRTVSDPEAIQRAAMRMAGCGSQDAFALLVDAAQKATRPAPSIRYSDPPEIRRLCSDRSIQVDNNIRQAMSVEIYRKRRAARKQWKLSLVASAADGDWAARKALTQRPNKPSAFAGLVQTSGGMDEACEDVRNYYRAKFERPEVDGMGLLHGLDYADEPEITADELDVAISRLKTGKATGPTLVSAELLLQLYRATQGRMSLLKMVNDALSNPSDLPAELFLGQVLLFPKKKWITQPSQTRPIVLGDVFSKLMCTITSNRVLRLSLIHI